MGQPAFSTDQLFICNEPDNTMQAFLDRSLSECTSFIFSVAFITRSGLASLKQTFLDLQNHHIPGKILTTDYLMFTEPSALKSLMSLKNIELKVFHSGNESKGFHTKGYLFFKDKVVSVTIGSSNLTGNAVAVNKEWNTCFTASDDSKIFKHIQDDFNFLWNSNFTRKVDDAYLDEYCTLYAEKQRIDREKTETIHNSKIVSLEQIKLQPNSMQLSFIKNLKTLRKEGQSKALLISATGTGKTYAAAFALRDIKPTRALFIVHREQILIQAKESFQNVFGDTRSFGLFSGTQNETDKDFLFATMQTMSGHFNEFSKNAFQVIVIDEAHHSGAESYQEIMNYFEPDLWLGMTASPDRPDSFDVYAAFDHNIVYEIRLQEAMKLNLLCPFHYYGITDVFVNGNEHKTKDFSRLICDDRVRYIIEKAEYFGHSGNRLKGLIFCSRLEEANELSEKFNSKYYKDSKSYYRTLVLSGSDSQEKRKKAVQRLESDNVDDALEYIFTVDLFNEGIDIPQVNQVIMLRPTESPVVFPLNTSSESSKVLASKLVIVIALPSEKGPF